MKSIQNMHIHHLAYRLLRKSEAQSGQISWGQALGFTICRDDDDKVVFKGWARMALPIEQFSIIEVRKPNVGENKPAGVEADVIIDLKGLTSSLWSTPRNLLVSAASITITS